jgi:hypothetical protein
LVSAALAYRRYSKDYIDAENEARKGQARDVTSVLARAGDVHQ